MLAGVAEAAFHWVCSIRLLRIRRLGRRSFLDQSDLLCVRFAFALDPGDVVGHRDHLHKQEQRPQGPLFNLQMFDTPCAPVAWERNEPNDSIFSAIVNQHRSSRTTAGVAAPLRLHRFICRDQVFLSEPFAGQRLARRGRKRPLHETERPTLGSRWEQT